MTSWPSGPEPATTGSTTRESPLIPGFRRVRQPGEAVSVLLLLDDGGVEFGDCAAVQYSGAGGRDPLFTAPDAVAAVEKVIAPALRGTDLGEGFRAVSARVDALTGPAAARCTPPCATASPRPCSPRWRIPAG